MTSEIEQKKLLVVPEEELKCPICLDMLFNPYTTDECGHSCCGLCYFDPRSRLATQNEEEVKCFLCNKKLGIAPVLHRSFTLKSICGAVYWNKPEHNDEFLKKQQRQNQLRAEKDYHDKLNVRKRQRDVEVESMLKRIDHALTYRGDILDSETVKRAKKAVTDIQMRPVTPPLRPASPPISEEAALALLSDATPMTERERQIALAEQKARQVVDISAWVASPHYRWNWLQEFRRLLPGANYLSPELQSAIDASLARPLPGHSNDHYYRCPEDAAKSAREYLQENCPLLLQTVPMEPVRVFAPRSCDQCRAPGFQGWCTNCVQFE